ncbi:MAG: lysylphosphatidylglycerol synthase transmembrane domain-containing protein [Actinomycetota bacterium]
MTRGQVVKLTLAALMSAAVVAFLVGRVDVEFLAAEFKGAKIPWLVAAGATLVPITGLRAWRFSLLLWRRRSAPPMGMCRIVAFMLFFNLILPFKTGELSFPILARRAYDIPLGTSLGALVLVRVLDLLSVVAIGGLATLALSQPMPPWVDGAAVLGAVCVPLLLAMPFADRLGSAVGRGLTGLPPRLLNIAKELHAGLRAVREWPDYALLLGLTLAIWLMQFVVAWMTLQAIGAHPFIHAVLASCAASVAFAFPVNGVASVGPLQAAWSAALSIVGTNWEQAVASAFLWHAVMLVETSLFAGLAALFPGRPAKGLEQDKGPA